jgi:hypothetical protein
MEIAYLATRDMWSIKEHALLLNSKLKTTIVPYGLQILV